MKQKFSAFLVVMITLVFVIHFARALTVKDPGQSKLQGQVLGASTIQRIQFKSGAVYTGSGNNLSVTLPNATVSGNELVVAVSDYYIADAPYTLSDNYGNTF